MHLGDELPIPKGEARLQRKVQALIYFWLQSIVLALIQSSTKHVD